MEAIKEWAKCWPPETHESEYAKKRILSAQAKQMTPVSINREDMFGCFQGRHGRYKTFLNKCECGDFHRSGMPCKHIYRLAMELGAMSGDYKTDPLAIQTPIQEMLPLENVIDKVESLPEDVQRYLLELSALYDSHSVKQFDIQVDEISDSLMTSGLISDCSGGVRKLLFGKKKDLENTLASMNLSYEKKMKAEELKDFCQTNYYDQLSKIYPTTVSIAFLPNVSVRNIHFYLHRKFDVALVLNGDSIEEIDLLDTVLPDDAVTGQLIKRGYYSRDNSKIILHDIKII